MSLGSSLLLMSLGACADVGGSDRPVASVESSLVRVSRSGVDSACALLLAGQTTVAGQVCADVVGNNLTITYTTSDGWTLSEVHLWADTSLATLPTNRSGNPVPGQFPYVSGPIATTSYTVSIPLAKFGLDESLESCDPVNLYVASHAVVQKANSDGSVRSETAWGEGPRIVAKGNWAMQFSLTLTCYEEEPKVAQCETAWAKLDDGQGSAQCFSEFDANAQWGWRNGPLAPGSYTFDLWAAAGRCDTSKGELVGSAGAEWNGSTWTVRLDTLAGSDFTFDEAHLYVGAGAVPLNKQGNETLAPGQFPNVADLTEATSYSFSGSLAGKEMYVFLHAKVCGTYKN